MTKEELNKTLEDVVEKMASLAKVATNLPMEAKISVLLQSINIIELVAIATTLVDIKDLLENGDAT